MLSQKPTSLLIDLDGVIRHWAENRAETMERTNGLPLGAIASVAFAPELLLPAITGQITHTAWNEQIIRTLQTLYPHANSENAIAQWSSLAGAMIDYDVLQRVQQYRATTQIVLVTNATSRLMDDLTAHGILEHFDLVINSSEVGIAKPDAVIFHHALAKAGATPERTVFVDDTAKNCATAKALGIESLHYTGIESLRGFMGRVSGST